MSIRTVSFVLAAAAAAALAPSTGRAGPDNQSLRACAAALAGRLGARNAGVPKYRLAQPYDSYFDSVADFYDGDYTFVLKAHDPRSGRTIADATCSATRAGVVESLFVTPVAAPPPPPPRD
jgi:hypothetical protein